MELAKSLVHESMHVMACDGPIPHDERWNNLNDADGDCEGHCGIYWGADELTAFIRGNPDFIRFVQAAK